MQSLESTLGDSQEDHTMDEGSQEPPFGDSQEALFEEKVVRSKRVTWAPFEV